MRHCVIADLIVICLLPLLGNCDYTGSSYANYVRLPLAALRQLPWQQNSTDNRDHCTGPDGIGFLIVKLPAESLLNDVEIVIGSMTHSYLEVKVAPSGEAAEALSRKRSGPCDARARDEKVWRPMRSQLQLPRTAADTKRIFRASLQKPEAMSYVLLLFNSVQFDEFQLGLFVSTKGPCECRSHHTLMLAASLALTLALLLFVGIVACKVVQCKVCTRKQGRKDKKIPKNIYSEQRDPEFPPDTGIYMT